MQIIELVKNLKEANLYELSVRSGLIPIKINLYYKIVSLVDAKKEAGEKNITQSVAKTFKVNQRTVQRAVFVMRQKHVVKNL